MVADSVRTISQSQIIKQENICDAQTDKNAGLLSERRYERWFQGLINILRQLKVCLQHVQLKWDPRLH